jgi:hypothetical protein
MKRRFYKIATCLPLILIVALGLRLGFAWDQERKIPRDLVGLVPFLQETGNIAFSIAQGRGFGSPYWQETGPTAWLTPVYPYLVAGAYKIFGIHTPHAFFAVVLLNILFSAGACIPIFYVGKRVGGFAVASVAAWLTPVYPYLVAGAYKIFGIHTPHAFFAVVLLNILFSAATCIPIFYVGKRVGGFTVASVAAWLWAIFPNAWIIPFEWVWDTSLSALLMATILWATLRLADGDAHAEYRDPNRAGSTTTRPASWRIWCWYGLLWGFALMTNPSLGVMLPFLIGWAVYRLLRPHEQGRALLKGPALAIGVAILCCVPWTVRNYFVFHRFIPLRSNFAFELWLGNNQNFDPQSQIVPAADPEREEIRNYIHMGETAFMQDKWNKAVRFMRSHPKLELILLGRRFVAMWTGMEKPVDGFLDSDSVLTRIALLSNFLAAIGAFCGIIVLFLRRSPYAFPLAAFPIVFPVVYYLTHASLRYRHPIDPIILLLTAVAIAAALDRRRLPGE